jgi:hypothetical protein
MRRLKTLSLRAAAGPAFGCADPVDRARGTE